MNNLIELKLDASTETIYFKKAINIKEGKFYQKQTSLGYYSINNKNFTKKITIKRAGRLIDLVKVPEDNCIYRRSKIYELDFVEDNGCIKPKFNDLSEDKINESIDWVIIKIDNSNFIETYLLYFNSSDLITHDKLIQTEIEKSELLRKLMDKKEHMKSLVIASLEPCEHKIIYNSTCTECYETNLSSKSFMIFDQISGLMTDTEHIDKKVENIKANKKLIMILDLDNTVIHAQRFTNTNRLDLYEKMGCKILSFRPYDNYVLKIRPFLIEFLEESSKYYEIFVYTFGTRDYALSVLFNIDPQEKLLSRKRLITRDESKLEIKELDKILPVEYNDILVIVDDTKIVWKNHKKNLVMILPYFFFKEDERLNKKILKEVENKVDQDYDQGEKLAINDIFINRNDCYLHFLGRHLKLINKIYYQYDGILTTAVISLGYY